MAADQLGSLRIGLRSQHLSKEPVHGNIERARWYLSDDLVNPSLERLLSARALRLPHVPVPPHSGRAKEHDKIGAVTVKLIVAEQSFFMLKEYLLRVLHVHHAIHYELIYFDSIWSGRTSTARDVGRDHFGVARPDGGLEIGRNSPLRD